MRAPRGKFKRVAVAPELAKRLAYYEPIYGPGVLGPRGWSCFGAYGSNGSSTYVTPQPITSKQFFSSDWQGIGGPAIQLSISVGDTSGRFEVARIIARVFPAHIAFVKAVIDEGIEPASDFPQGPYPKDRLTYKSNEEVEYVTPPNSTGLGTDTRLLPNSDPISGVAILTGEEFSLSHLAVRLPLGMDDLAASIIQQVKPEAAH